MERHYQNQFTCSTFTPALINSCKNNPEDTTADPAAQQAAITYAQDNLAHLKIFIK